MIEKTENMVLGTIIAIPDYQEQIITCIGQKLFTKKANKIILGAIQNLYKNGSKIDLLTINNLLTKDETEQIGGAYYLASLTNNIASGLHWEDHVNILREHYIRTELIMLFTTEINNLGDRTIDIQETYLNVTKRQEELFTIPTNQFKPIYDLMLGRLDQYELAAKSDNRLIGINTGHSKLNKITGGWQPGDLIILAARPSMGKTAVSLFFAKFAALQSKKDESIPYYSIEMKAERLSDRIISLESEIDSQKLLSGQIESYQWETLTDHVSKYKDAQLLIDDECVTIEQVKHSSIVLATKGKVLMILIDYLQLMKPSGVGHTTNEEIGHITRSCKQLGKKLECPVILLSQLNRDVEKRAGSKRPQLSDLRDSGNIEQDADIVIFIHRPEYYGFIEDEEGNSLKNVIELIIAKDRNGAIGNTYMHKNDNWSYMGELPYDEYCSMNDVIPYEQIFE